MARASIRFKADLIGLNDVRDWSRDEKGNVRYKSGQFFGVEGGRIASGNLREVASWDQPIYTQPEGGILGLIAREHAAKGVEGGRFWRKSNENVIAFLDDESVIKPT